MSQVVILFACVYMIVYVYSLSFEFVFQPACHGNSGRIYEFAPPSGAYQEGIWFWLLGDSEIDYVDDDDEDDDDDNDKDALQWCPIMIMI